jgi:hypothetical protein
MGLHSGTFDYSTTPNLLPRIHLNERFLLIHAKTLLTRGVACASNCTKQRCFCRLQIAPLKSLQNFRMGDAGDTCSPYRRIAPRFSYTVDNGSRVTLA